MLHLRRLLSVKDTQSWYTLVHLTTRLNHGLSAWIFVFYLSPPSLLHKSRANLFSVLLWMLHDANIIGTSFRWDSDASNPFRTHATADALLVAFTFIEWNIMNLWFLWNPNEVEQQHRYDWTCYGVIDEVGLWAKTQVAQHVDRMRTNLFNQ